jgi:hypothetical protein
LDKGIFCHYCRGAGLRDFVHFGELIKDRQRKPNQLKIAAKNRTHWEHARYIVEEATGETKHAELIYRALLKLAHIRRDDKPERVEATLKLNSKVFFPKLPFVRTTGAWSHPNLKTCYNPGGMKDALKHFPVCRYIDDDENEEKVNPLTLSIFAQNGDLSAYGYPALIPVRGVDFRWHERLCISIPRDPGAWPSVHAVVPADPPFQERKVTPEAIAWMQQYVNASYPGVDFQLLRLLIAAKAVTQLNPSEPPLIMISGASGSAKTATVLLAAEIACDTVATISMGRDKDKFKRSVVAGAEKCTFICIDEVAKDPDVGDYLVDHLLSLKRGADYHKFYVGQVCQPRQPVIVMCDTAVPRVMFDEVQLSRRIVYVDHGAGITSNGKNWRDTCFTGDIVGWRAAAKESTLAADLAVSEVMQGSDFIDMNFIRIAERLGFPLMRDAGGSDVDNDSARRALFHAVCAADDLVNHPRWKGRGFKLIDLDRTDELVLAFRDAVGDVSRDAFDPAALQAVTGAQWVRILGVPGVEIDLDIHGRRAAIRFRVGGKRSPDLRVNGEILPPNAAAA